MFSLYCAALMATELPDEFDCRQLPATGAQLSGAIAAARLRRIELPYRVDGPVRVRLTVQARAGGGFAVSGELAVPLAAQCQRCLEWMVLPLQLPVAVVAVTAAQAAQLEDADWVALVDEKLQVSELVEDEVLLGCPLAPRHDTATCGPGAASATVTERKQPFARLADLLGRRNET